MTSGSFLSNLLGRDVVRGKAKEIMAASFVLAAIHETTEYHAKSVTDFYQAAALGKNLRSLGEAIDTMRSVLTNVGGLTEEEILSMWTEVRDEFLQESDANAPD